jgi:hypothetical protein
MEAAVVTGTQVGHYQGGNSRDDALLRGGAPAARMGAAFATQLGHYRVLPDSSRRYAVMTRDHTNVCAVPRYCAVFLKSKCIVQCCGAASFFLTDPN